MPRHLPGHVSRSGTWDAFGCLGSGMIKLKDAVADSVQEYNRGLEVGRLADPPERKRGDRDAELRRGKVCIEVIDGALQRPSVRPSLGNQLGDTTAAHGNQRELGGNEEAIGEDEEGNSTLMIVARGSSGDNMGSISIIGRRVVPGEGARANGILQRAAGKRSSSAPR
jgi:hypothetical protein